MMMTIAFHMGLNKERGLSKLLNGSIRLLMVFCAGILLSACSHNLPSVDRINKVSNYQGILVAESKDYVYKFSGDKAQQQYAAYYQFYKTYKDSITRVQTTFVITDNSVDAVYKNYFRTAGMSDEQLKDLREQYSATIPAPVGFGMVAFRAKGEFIRKKDSSLYSTDESGVLEQPIPVSITDNNVSAGDLILMPLVVPVFPLIMMYGCATGPCV